jgi:CRP-like cAMP-binding protein
MLSRGSVLSEPEERIPFVYFPEGCVASVIKVLSNGKRIEVGTAGIEGMAGLPVFLGAETVPLLCLIQVPGRAQCMAAEDVRRLASAGTGLHAILQRYAQYQFDQAAQSIACNWFHRIDHRCARWLLMTQDRVQADHFDLTHEYLATMLGARRAGVSEVAEALKAAGLIKYRRGKITIVDRAGLERASCECYARDRSDYQRLLTDL